jgi:BlaI family penicillinase repressor
MNKRILDCEWIILRAMWGQESQSMGEIIAKVQRAHPEIEWKYKTYHSYLRVMVDKGLIGCDVLNAKEKRYFHLVTREEALEQESETILARISEKSLGRMMAMMVQKASLSESDKKELAELFHTLNQDEGGESQ